MQGAEKSITRQHTFFCTNLKRHSQASDNSNTIATTPKEITVFGKTIRGWLVTREEMVIEKVITLEEAVEPELTDHDPE